MAERLADLGQYAVPGNSLADLSGWAVLDPFERASLRTLQSVLSRKEGKATQSLSALGEGLYNAAAKPSRIWNELQGVPAGQPLSERPDIVDAVAQTATDVVGLPAITGGVPAGAVGSAANGIRAYHGSPHDFDRFDINRIGTGEGAQAYGHGLYFAENEGTARSYRDALSELKDRKIQGTDLTVPSWVAKTIESRNPIAINDMRTNFQGRLDEMRRKLADPNTMQPWNIEGHIPGIERILKAIDEFEKGAKIAPAGRMYEVNINAKPEQFLDWDKALSGQSPQIQAALDKVYPVGSGNEVGANYYRAVGRDAAMGPTPPTGEGLYSWLANQAPGSAGMSDALASQRLAGAGIPGIKYLDQGSRKGGDFFAQLPSEPGGYFTVGGPGGISYGKYPNRAEAQAAAEAKNAEGRTSNYVLFDDKLIDILRKYGIALPGAGLAAAGADNSAPD